MAKIIISAESGEVTEIIPEEEIGDLDRPLARAALMDTIKIAVEDARRKDAQ